MQARKAKKFKMQLRCIIVLLLTVTLLSRIVQSQACVAFDVTFMPSGGGTDVGTDPLTAMAF